MQVYADFMNGSESKHIPPFSNYTIGYKIMQSYLQKNPQVKTNEWTVLNPKEILQNSDYPYLLK
ncbi:DUF2268 domain-containing putative Zn-dependent protease [Peribacillus sp. SCS-26]|uniref:DUF2268 domain-containing putative Zn-dependent protease n=1 Tax=Paraperibacillus marinus TaxID=3115295 RepID=UPI00390638BE